MSLDLSNTTQLYPVLSRSQLTLTSGSWSSFLSASLSPKFHQENRYCHHRAIMIPIGHPQYSHLWYMSGTLPPSLFYNSLSLAGVTNGSTILPVTEHEMMFPKAEFNSELSWDGMLHCLPHFALHQ